MGKIYIYINNVFDLCINFKKHPKSQFCLLVPINFSKYKHTFKQMSLKFNILIFLFKFFYDLIACIFLFPLKNGQKKHLLFLKGKFNFKNI